MSHSVMNMVAVLLFCPLPLVTRGGRFSDGWGACDRREKKFNKPNHDIPSTAETRAKSKASQVKLSLPSSLYSFVTFWLLHLHVPAIHCMLCSSRA